MASTTRWIGGGGVGLTWTAAGFTATDFDSLAAGSGVVAATAIANNTPLDIYADVSFALTAASAPTVASFLSLYLLPLNQDGSTYGDGLAAGVSAVAPPAGYQVGAIGLRANTAMTGTFRGIVMPPGAFKFALWNNLVAIAFANMAGAGVVKYRSFVENLNG